MTGGVSFLRMQTVDASETPAMLEASCMVTIAIIHLNSAGQHVCEVCTNQAIVAKEQNVVMHAEIGIGLTGLGFLFLFLGVLFFFDKGLIALGNVRRRSLPCSYVLHTFTMQRLLCRPHWIKSVWYQLTDYAAACMQLMFVCGVALTIGPQATLKFFIRKKNLKVLSCFPAACLHLALPQCGATTVWERCALV